ncbi:MAG: ATP-binding protein [Actinobacteria bacterium]|nr:MAG: ATP-binding protein [Actinomycetota bacterium]
MKSFFDGNVSVTNSGPPEAIGPVERRLSETPSLAPTDRASAARVAIYDSLTASPRVEDVTGADARAFVEALSSRAYQLSHECGGSLPYMVIREVVENLIHAHFAEVVVTILDNGNTIRFADQGPGIPDKERVFVPGFSTATHEMKTVIKGVGSGLPVARECLTFSSGTITIEDNLGRGCVVTIHVDPDPVVCDDPADTPRVHASTHAPRLTLRQKQVLSLVLEMGSVGPSVVSKELGVGLSTAYRDLASLEDCGLIISDENGKRVLAPLGADSLDSLFNN